LSRPTASRRIAGRGSAVAIALLALAPISARAQLYLEPVPSAPGVRIDARALADRDAARALGIPLVEDLPAMSHGRAHVEGARAVLVVLARFEDTPDPLVSADEVRARMFTGTPTSKTIAEFYEDQSGGRFTVTGDVTDWLQTDVTLLEGAGSVDGHGVTGDSLRVHIARLLQQLDPVLDFGQFDNDGPDGVPNSPDDNGRVDLLSIKFAEVGGHCGGPGPWPHFGGVSVDGGPFISNDLTPAGTPITVPVYIMDSVVECDGTTPQSIAVTAHELGHAIGLPDYYRAVDGIEAENRHWVVGCFDLMAAGGWGCGDGALPTDGFGPTGFSAYSRWTLGWAELEDITAASDETFVLEPLSTSAHALRVRLAPESLESWIIEYRTRDGFDAPLPADGVLIYHHDGFAGSRPTDPSLAPPYPFHLVEADGDDALRRVAADGGNRGVATDVFARADPSGPLGPATVPSTRDHLGGQSTLHIHEIVRAGPTASVRLSVGTGFRVATRQVPAQATVFEPVVGTIELADGQEPYALAEQLGDLPDDLVIGLTGSTLSVGGTPRVAGTFGLSVWIDDQAGATLAESIPLRVLDDPSIDPATFLGALVGAASLSPDQAIYLDRSGNDDGALDLGDLRAFVRRRPFP
jgi:M6 family metalloprotease-like protein